MKISEKFPQFKDETALIIVTGWQAAAVYRASGGRIVQAGDLKIPNPKYSDREGFFVKPGGRGQNYGGGAGMAYERIKNKVKKDFLKSLASVIGSAAAKNKIDAVYIFSPSRMLKDVENVLPKPLRKSVRSVFGGNYVHHHPFDLLEKISGRKK